jgi:hypothetical protein
LPRVSRRWLRRKCKQCDRVMRPMVADGRFELYKTSKKYDGPPGREQHEFPPKEQLESWSVTLAFRIVVSLIKDRW